VGSGNSENINLLEESQSVGANLGHNSKSVLSLDSSVVSPQARLSVSVPRGLYKKLKLLAHDREMTLSELLLQLIKAEIE